MSYRLRLGESATTNLRRLLREQIAEAVQVIETEGSRDVAAHEARKRAKKARAALRLFRDGLDATYAAENAAFRDLARPLAPFREAAARLETVDALREAARSDEERSAVRAVGDACLRLREALDAEQLDAALENARRRLLDASGRAEALAVEGPLAAAARGGLKRVYRRNRQAWPAAFAEGRAEAFHEWRKRAKYHRYHVALLRPAWKKPLKGREKALHDLTDLLGLEHDLSDLDRAFDAHATWFDEAAVVRTRALVSRRRAELRAAARAEALRAFCERPGRFTARLGSYLRAGAESAPVDA